MSKHTPGPWRYERDRDDGIHCVHAYVWGPRVSISTSGNLDYTEPDMRLIAAAPELLEALQAYIQHFEAHHITNTHGARDFDFTGHIAALARAAIAKATG